MTGIAFHIHNRINTNSMRVRTGTCAEYDNFSANMFSDKIIRFVHIHNGRFNFRNMNGGKIYGMNGRAVAVKKGKSFCKFFVINNLRIFKPHFFH